MKEDKRFEIVKDIPLRGGKKIAKGSTLMRTHGVYFLDGGMLSPDYQADFDALIEQEERQGLGYIKVVKTKYLDSDF